MRSLLFQTGFLYSYVLTGKFTAPSEEWKHDVLYLNEYELFVMTEGVLYLRYARENFTVTQGEYLLLPPCNEWRQGFKSAYSSFYWLHFSQEVRTGENHSSLCEDPYTNLLHENLIHDAAEDASAHEDTPPQPPAPHPPREGSSGYLPSDSSAPMPPRDSDPCIEIPQQGTIPKPEKLVVLMKQLQDTVRSGYPALTLDAMSTAIIMELYGELCLQKSRRPAKISPRKQIYADITDYIQNNITSNLRVEDIAHHFGYNEKYLSHLFAQVNGVTMKQYILNQKVDVANLMLTDTNRSIEEIAKELGFSDSHNFSRMYKRITGLTPSEYRNTFEKRMLFHN